MQANQNQNQKTPPTFAQVVKALSVDVNEAFNNDTWNELLNMPPHASWLKKHPFATAKNDQGQTVPALYLPIDKVEFLLTYIYGKWKVEVLKVQPLFNSVQVTVRLHVRNPITLEWEWNDGVGAVPVQTNAGASAADLSQVKSAAVQMCAPAAETYAEKDAAEKFGRIFGRDLNRRDTIMFSGAYTEKEPQASQTTKEEPQVQQPAWQQPVNPYVSEPQHNGYQTTNNGYQNTANNHSQPFNLSAL